MGTGIDVDKLDGFRPPIGDEKERYCNECIKKDKLRINTYNYMVNYYEPSLCIDVVISDGVY